MITSKEFFTLAKSDEVLKVMNDVLLNNLLEC